MKLSELNKETAVCWECKGKPDEVYIRGDGDGDEEVIAVICKDCKQAAEATIRSIKRAMEETSPPDQL